MLLVDKQDSGKPLTQNPARPGTGKTASQDSAIGLVDAALAGDDQRGQAGASLLKRGERVYADARAVESDHTSQSHLDESGTPICTNRASICTEHLPHRSPLRRLDRQLDLGSARWSSLAVVCVTLCTPL